MPRKPVRLKPAKVTQSFGPGSKEHPADSYYTTVETPRRGKVVSIIACENSKRGVHGGTHSELRLPDDVVIDAVLVVHSNGERGPSADSAPIGILNQYARLLRRAWLNPSYKPWQQDVHDFEHKHDDVLRPAFKEWSEADRERTTQPRSASMNANEKMIYAAAYAVSINKSPHVGDILEAASAAEHAVRCYRQTSDAPLARRIEDAFNEFRSDDQAERVEHERLGMDNLLLRNAMMRIRSALSAADGSPVTAAGVEDVKLIFRILDGAKP
jgi:hypothetical protein